jgi:nitroreductase/NAD-dependent dihydropyrimidine dehydrogenase PreA subunit
MDLFTIDQDKCNRDGLCVIECPARIIELIDPQAFPSPVKNAEENCLKCGHCVAICPLGALTLKDMPLDECPPLQKELLPNAEHIRHFLKARRSIRRFKEKSVPHELIKDLIDTARYAPTGSNKQQVNWMIFENPAEVRRLAAIVIDWTRLIIQQVPDKEIVSRMERLTARWDDGVDPILQGAPHLILVHSQKDLPSAQTDCVIALTYLELYASAQGLGTCWAGYFTSAANAYPPLAQALNLPAEHHCFGAVMLGFPRYKYTRIPKRNAPLVTWR